jgi:DNA-binding transcriptional ArsR family regulator
MLIRWALRDSGLPATDKLVLIALASRAGHQGAAAGTCYPSQGTIAADTGLSRRTVNRSIKRLLEAGLVKALGGGAASGERITYRLLKGETQDHTPTTENHTPTTQDLRGYDTGSQGVRTSGVGGTTQDPTKGTSKRTKKRATEAGSRARAHEAEAPLPDDWTPTREQIHWAETHYLDYDLAVDQAEAFKAYFTAGRGRNEQRTARGWKASLQSWYRKVDGYRPDRRDVPLPAAKARQPTRFEQEQLALEGGGA